MIKRKVKKQDEDLIQYDIDMACKYGDWDSDNEDGLTQYDIDMACKYGDWE